MEDIFIQDQRSQLTMITIYGYILELETLKSFKNSQVRVQNRLYGIKDVNFPNFVKVNPTGMSQCVKHHQLSTGSDLGWYVNLQKPKN